MAWSRYETAFTRHPKVLAIDRKHRAVAIALHVAATGYSGEILTDGYVPEDALFGLGREIGIDKLDLVVDALVKTGLFDKARGGWRVHDYLDFNPSAEDVKEQRRRANERQKRSRERRQEQLPIHVSRRESHRESQRDKSGDEPVDDALSQRDSRVTNSVTSRAGVAARVPTPNPTLEDQEQRAAAVHSETEAVDAARTTEQSGEPAAAGREPPAESRVRDLVSGYPDADRDGIATLVTLALQISGDRFERLAERAAQPTVHSPSAWLRRRLEQTIRAQRITRANEIAVAAGGHDAARHRRERQPTRDVVLNQVETLTRNGHPWTAIEPFVDELLEADATLDDTGRHELRDLAYDTFTAGAAA